MVPPALRSWFVFHCWADLVFAVPLFLAPEPVLHLCGWTAVDPIATRIAAAALFGIGIESWLGRNASADAFRQMLMLKCIWSFTATLGIVWSQVESDHPPVLGWALALIFAGFHTNWQYWRLVMNKSAPA